MVGSHAKTKNRPKVAADEKIEMALTAGKRSRENNRKKFRRGAPPLASGAVSAAGVRLKKRRTQSEYANPSPPITQNDARQLTFSARNPLSVPPNAIPTIWLVPKIAMTRDCTLGGCAAAIRANAAGTNKDSEIPSKPRQTSKNG